MIQQKTRLKIARMTAKDVLQMAIGFRRVADAIAVPCLPDIPEDAELLSVHFDYAYGAFNFVLFHPSFAEVPDGGMIPCEERPLTHVYKTVRIELPQAEDDPPFVACGRAPG